MSFKGPVSEQMVSQARHVSEQLPRWREPPSQTSFPQDKPPQSPKLFMYCSTPRPVPANWSSSSSYGQPRPKYRNNVPKPEGFHSYYNISWDPRVRRGDPSQARKKKEAEELEKIRRKLAQPRRKQPRQNSMSNDAKGDSNAIDPPAMIRAANMRYARLAISALRPKEKDAFFQDLADELDQDELCYKGQRIGAERMLPQGPSTKKNMVNQASQIWPGEFFDFDKEVVPVIERLVGRICYQARLEVLEEAEQEALKMEREMFAGIRNRDETEMSRLHAKSLKETAELKRQADLASAQSHDGKSISTLFAGCSIKFDAEEALEATGGSWRAESRLQSRVESELRMELNDEVEQKMSTFLAAEAVLDDIIQSVVSQREAELAADMHRDSEDPVRIYSEERQLSSGPAPPPTPGTSEYYTSAEEEDDNRSHGEVPTAAPSGSDNEL